MKNIEAILTEYGIEIPADKKEALLKAVNENYKTVAEVTKLQDNLTAEKAKVADAEATIKKFEGIDPEKFKEEVEGYKKRAEEAENTYKSQLAERDFNDALTKELDAIKFSSTAARKSIEAQVKGAGLKLSAGKILGLNDLIEQIKAEDSSAFVSQAEDKRARFSERKDGTGGNLTKDDIMAIKDRDERLNAIAENLDLFDK